MNRLLCHSSCGFDCRSSNVAPWLVLIGELQTSLTDSGFKLLALLGIVSLVVKCNSCSSLKLVQ